MVQSSHSSGQTRYGPGSSRQSHDNAGAKNVGSLNRYERQALSLQKLAIYRFDKLVSRIFLYGGRIQHGVNHPLCKGEAFTFY